MDKEKSGLREEDNIEKDGLQEDNDSSSQNDVYDGLDDFVDYDDLTSLEGLPQLDELDKMDDLSAVPEVAASIKMDDTDNKNISDDEIEVPLPDIGITDDDGIASELSDEDNIQTVFPEPEPEKEETSSGEKEQLAQEEETVADAGKMEDTDGVALPEEETMPIDDIMPIPEDDTGALDDIMAIPERDTEVSDDIMAIPEGDTEVSDNIMAIPEGDTESSDDIMAIPEGDTESQDDIMAIPEGDTESQDDIMKASEGEAEPKNNDSGSESIDDMLGGLLDDLDTNGSIADGAADSSDISESGDEEVKTSDDIGDLLGMLSDDSGSDDIMSLDNTADNAIPDVNDIPDISLDDSGAEEDIANILPTEEKKEDGAEQPGFFKKVFGNVVTDEIAEAEKQAKEDEAAKLEEAEKLKEEKALEKAQEKEEKAKLKAEKAEEKAAKKAKKAEEKAAKKAAKLAKKEEEEAAAAQEVVGKLNKVGVAIVAVIGLVFLLGTVFLTNSFGSNLDKKKAQNYFDMNRYSQAYESAVGTNMKKKDPEQYQKIVTVMKVQHSLDSYQNYENIKKYPEALDALLIGLRKYDANKKEAYDLEIEDKLENIYEKILDILSEEFGVSKSQAYDILGLSGSDYTKKVTEIANK